MAGESYSNAELSPNLGTPKPIEYDVFLGREGSFPGWRLTEQVLAFIRVVAYRGWRWCPSEKIDRSCSLADACADAVMGPSAGPWSVWEKVGCTHAEVVGKAVQRSDRDVLAAGLDMNHVRSVDPHRGRQLRLRQAGSAACLTRCWSTPL